ncbi:hypothetical protein CEXT_345511 [Caerostris extrusa]|uniref:Uncharacterized protein n=1 Tax=Caerostris extrusa TaxID=172846 RepID=A0AAV4R2Z7_CAEEX|nr:hypothetical protein CEXT_345511 [Caerostris extrusa]
MLNSFRIFTLIMEHQKGTFHSPRPHFAAEMRNVRQDGRMDTKSDSLTKSRSRLIDRLCLFESSLQRLEAIHHPASMI